MDIKIQSIHFDATEKLQAFIEKKVAKLEKAYEDINNVEVQLKVVKPATAQNKETKITAVNKSSYRCTKMPHKICIKNTPSINEGVFFYSFMNGIRFCRSLIDISSGSSSSGVNETSIVISTF